MWFTRWVKILQNIYHWRPYLPYISTAQFFHVWNGKINGAGTVLSIPFPGWAKMIRISALETYRDDYKLWESPGHSWDGIFYFLLNSSHEYRCYCPRLNQKQKHPFILQAVSSIKVSVSCWFWIWKWKKALQQLRSSSGIQRRFKCEHILLLNSLPKSCLGKWALQNAWDPE